MKNLTLTLDDATFHSAERQAQKVGKPLTAVALEWLRSFSSTGEPGSTGTAAAADDEKRRAQGLAALHRIASRGGIAGIEDPVAWQREQRAERPLPGRDS